MGVAVIGGGIGGLTTAVALQRRGITSTVHEQAPDLNEIGAGIALWPSALSVMDLVGLGSAVRALRRPWAIAAVRRHDGSLLVRYTSEDLAASLGEPTIAGHCGELQSVLLSALPPGAVHTGRRCERIVRRDETVALHFTDGAVVVADAVIGADGLRSMTGCTSPAAEQHVCATAGTGASWVRRPSRPAPTGMRSSARAGGRADASASCPAVGGRFRRPYPRAVLTIDRASTVRRRRSGRRSSAQ